MPFSLKKPVTYVTHAKGDYPDLLCPLSISPEKAKSDLPRGAIPQADTEDWPVDKLPNLPIHHLTPETACASGFCKRTSANVWWMSNRCNFIKHAKPLTSKHSFFYSPHFYVLLFISLSEIGVFFFLLMSIPCPCPRGRRLPILWVTFSGSLLAGSNVELIYEDLAWQTNQL